MLDVKIDRELVRVMAKGSSDVIIGEVAQLIGSLYAQLKMADTECAEEFRRVLLCLLEDDDSPVWQMDPAVGGVASVVPVGQE
jgi:hypothetical protein